MKKEVMIIFFICLTFLLGLIFIGANDDMVVEANFVNFGELGEEIISIQVPDYIFLGIINKDNPFKESNMIRINNTGTVDTRVTPQLASDASEVFNYTYFRKQKSTTTNDTSLTAFHKIGEYEVNVNKNNHATFYMSLNLTDFNGTLPSNDINLSATIKFTAMAA
jgi:hypothetical protein